MVDALDSENELSVSDEDDPTNMTSITMAAPLEEEQSDKFDTLGDLPETPISQAPSLPQCNENNAFSLLQVNEAFIDDNKKLLSLLTTPEDMTL
jgi:hypothetical protein